MTETWLTDRVERSRRAVSRRRCPKCGAGTLVGPDHDRMAATACVDVTPIRFAYEAELVASGVPTYDLIGPVLYYRDRHNRDTAKYPIHAEHKCPEQLTLGGN